MTHYFTTKGIKYEDFVNYKKPSMFIMTTKCSFKCDKENGCQLCQNMPLVAEPNVKISYDEVICNYLNNPITKAIVFGGLEPFDTYAELQWFIYELRSEYGCFDDVVIYTGYTEEELADKLPDITCYGNIIIKFGRFRPNQKPHLDPVLGVELASDNQYAVEWKLGE